MRFGDLKVGMLVVDALDGDVSKVLEVGDGRVKFEVVGIGDDSESKIGVTYWASKRWVEKDFDVHNPADGTTPPSNNILDEAKHVVDGPRRSTYGHPRENHARTAAMWTAYLAKKLKPGETITMRDVCLLNAAQKISRDANSPHRDNLVDLAGWSRNAELVEESST